MNTTTHSTAVKVAGATAHTPRLSAVAGAIWLKTVSMLRRYAFNTISQMLSLYVLFLIVFYGAQGIGTAVGGAPAAVGTTLDATIIGFFLWFLALTTSSDLSWGIMNEARLGTLEQQMMTPVGFRWVSLLGVFTNTVVSLLMSGVILAAMVLTTGRQLHIDFITVVPLLILISTTTIGIGFITAGLALVYKRVDAVFQMMQFVFIAFIGAPALIKSVPLLTLVPIALPSLLLNEAMAGGVRLFELGTDRLLLSVVSAAVYLALGLFIFGRAERKARNDGTLAQY